MRATYFDGIASFLCNMCDGAKGSGVQHDLVLVYERVLPYFAEDVAAGDVISNLDTREVSGKCQCELPLYLEVCRREIPLQ